MSARRSLYNHLVAPLAGGPVHPAEATRMLDDYRAEVLRQAAEKDTRDADESTRALSFPPRGGHREACAYAAGISRTCTCHLGEFLVCSNRPCVRGEWSTKAAERGWEKQADGSWLDPQCAANAADRLDYLTAIARTEQGGEDR